MLQPLMSAKLLILASMILLNCASLCSVAASYNGAEKLYADIIAPFNRRIRPSKNTSEPITINVAMTFTSLREIVEAQQYIIINAWIEFAWLDEIRAWNSSDYDGVKVLYLEPNDVWRPRVIITNSIEERDVFEDNYAGFAISSDGKTRWYPGTVFSLSCTMDMTYFPFDKQSCSMMILTQRYASDVLLVPNQNTVRTVSYEPNGEWELESTKVETQIITYEDVQFSALRYTFDFRRRPTFLILNFLVPVLLTTLLSPLVFALPVESGERVSYSVTMLLSLTLFLGIVSGDLPQNSDTMPLTVLYLFVMIIHSSLCVVCCVVHLCWHHSTQDKKDEDRGSSNISQSESLNRQERDGRSQEFNQRQATRSQRPTSDVDGRSVSVNDTSDMKTVTTNISVSTVTTRNSFIGRKLQSPQRTVKMKRCWKCLWNVNSILFLVFYISWFAVSLYFLVRLLENSQ